MNITVDEIIRAFDLLYQNLLRNDFSKSLRLHEWNEKDLLPLVRTYLLGYFGESITPEAKAILPGSPSGNGRIDFLVGNIAVEFATRQPNAAKANVSAAVNSSEVKKLMKHKGLALLVLYDFSKNPYTTQEMEIFRNCPSLGSGPHSKSPFNLAYYYVKSRRPITTDIIKKNVRVY